MNETMRECPHCGCSVSKTATRCIYCGMEITPLSVPETPVKKEKKGKKFTTILVSVISTIVAISIGRFVGGLVAEVTFDDYSESKIERELQKEIEDFEKDFQENYVPGAMYGNRYVSEHFGLVFDFDENWELMSDEALKEVASDAWEGGFTNAIEYLDEEDIPDDLKDTLKSEILDSFYAEAEVGANYYDYDGIPVANVTVLVMSVYGIDQTMLSDTIEDGMEEFEDAFGDVKVRTELVGGEAYEVIEVSIEENGLIANLRQYIREENGVICLVQYAGIDGFDDEAEKSFMKMFDK